MKVLQKSVSLMGHELWKVYKSSGWFHEEASVFVFLLLSLFFPQKTLILCCGLLLVTARQEQSVTPTGVRGGLAK
jgi:hypothetical protein